MLKFCNGMAGMFNGVVTQNQSSDILCNQTIVTVGDIFEDYDIRKVLMMISTWKWAMLLGFLVNLSTALQRFEIPFPDMFKKI